jgi:hypothetical protein
MSMVDVEKAWQNTESMRDAHCRRKYDPTRGGGRLSKGNLYYPVFRGLFHDIFFLELDINKVVKCTSVDVGSSGSAGGSCTSEVAQLGRRSSSGVHATDHVGAKRARVAEAEQV